jgi:ribose 5-phosphate isomerase A
MPIYVDGADEINPHGHMIKGGGGALTREKIIASMAQDFICICDETKLVQQLGRFPLPVEIIPLAQTAVTKALALLGGQAQLRLIKSGKAEGQPYLTDNKAWILDIHGLSIQDPIALEEAINQIPGVISVGLFAKRKADVLLLGKKETVETLRFS